MTIINTCIFTLLLYFISLFQVISLKAEIKTCPACKLNYLPEVARFIKEPGHADAYKNVKVTFIRGHNPDLFIMDDSDKVIEKIDLSNMKTDEIHKLLVTKGFERLPEGSRVRKHQTLRSSLINREVFLD